VVKVNKPFEAAVPRCSRYEAYTDSGYDVTTLRLGAPMREAGFEPVGADANRHFSGAKVAHGCSR
jgi:hypothetical protein